MRGTYNHWLVALLIVVAVMACFTALDLGARLARDDGLVSRLWLFGGAISMGVGIWSIRLIRMFTFSLPIALRYDILTTLEPLGIAIVTSSAAIKIAGGAIFERRPLGIRGLVMLAKLDLLRPKNRL